jgi:hypothetical protein
VARRTWPIKGQVVQAAALQIAQESLHPSLAPLGLDRLPQQRVLGVVLLLEPGLASLVGEEGLVELAKELGAVDLPGLLELLRVVVDLGKVVLDVVGEVVVGDEVGRILGRDAAWAAGSKFTRRKGTSLDLPRRRWVASRRRRVPSAAHGLQRRQVGSVRSNWPLK